MSFFKEAKRYFLIGMGGLLACDPQGGGTTATAGETAASTAGETEPSTGEASTDGATDGPTTGSSEASTGAPTTSGGTGEELGCADVRWAYDVAKFHEVGALAVDSRGHVRATVPGGEAFRVLDLDENGVEVGALEVAYAGNSVRWGGIDGEDNVVLQVQENGPQWPRDWVRKYALDGTLLWEVEFASASDGFVIGTPVPGPDGSVLITRSASLHKLDADGSAVWEQPNPDFMQPSVVNAAGVSVGWLVSTKWVRTLGPDGALLWEVEWGQEAFDDRTFAVDGAGGVVVGEQHHALARFASDGTLAWEKSRTELGRPIDAIAMNEAGQLAVLGRPGEGSPEVLRLDPDGAEVGRRACDQLTSQKVAIDAAGRVTVAGYDFISESGQFDWWVVAFAD